MTGKYDDMLYLPHHVSKTRARMSATDRGAQFSPFAALVGYGEVIRETARRTCRRVELTDSEKEAINHRLCRLLQPEYAGAAVQIRYFQPDLWKEGGEYVTAAGSIRQIDPLYGVLTMTDGREILIDDIQSLECDDLPEE